MWGYFIDGKCIATNPNDMSGNTGWELVPEDTVPELQPDPVVISEPTIEQRQVELEAALIELASIVMGGV